MKKIYKYLFVVSLLFMVLGMTILPLSANAFKSGENSKNIVVENNEFVPYNFVVAGGLIDFRGEAQKDVIVTGGTITINGPVHGDVIAVGGNIKIDGNVDGNVRILGGTVDINGRVGKNVTVAGGSINFGIESDVGWDVMVGGGSVVFNGKVNGNINVGAGNLTLSGEVGGNVDVYVGNDGSLNILEETKIDGNLNYWSIVEVVMPQNVNIGGKIEHHSTIDQMIVKNKKNNLVYFFSIFISLFSALIICLIVVKLFKGQVTKVNQKMIKHPWISLGSGFVYLILIPIISLLLLPLIVTIPLSIILIIIYGLIIYFTKFFIIIILGKYVLRFYKKLVSKNKKTDQDEENKFSDVKNYESSDVEDASFSMSSIIFGVVVYLFIINIPIFGLIVSFVAMVWALGAIGWLIKEWIKERIK